MNSRLITVAIHTYDRALELKNSLEAENIQVVLQNVNLEQPAISSGVRVRIHESDLALALRIIEHPDIFGTASRGISADNDSVSHAIVVPTDFSRHSFNAALAAARLAAAHKVQLRILHAYIDPHITGNVRLNDKLTYELADQQVTEQLVEKVNRNMDAFLSELRERMKSGDIPAVRYSGVIVEGVPEDAIIDYAKTKPPYLMVMGTREARQKEIDMIGSVTAEVLDASRFTVLSIPDCGDLCNISTASAPQNVLFFSNLDQDDILAIDTLYRLFPTAGAKVTIVNIPSRHRYNDKNAGRAAMALSDYCSRSFANYTFESVPITPKNALVELKHLQNESKFDLIVIPSRRKNAISRLFNPGLAHKILFEADIPMLVIPV